MGLFFSKGFTPEDLPDLTGKVIIVTGGAGGVGFALVVHLARRGAKVYVAARSEDSPEEAIQRQYAAGLGNGKGQIVWLPLDLADPRVAKKSAEEFMRKEERLDVLINCAAIIICPYVKSHDGIQDVVMVNYIGHNVFTRTLMPVLKRTASEPNSDVRIVCVSSDGYDAVRHPVQFKSIEDFNLEYKDNVFPWPSLQRYCYSKLLVMFYASELQRRLDEEGVPIIVLTTHPGVIHSDGVKKWLASLKPGLITTCVHYLVSRFATLPTQGAYSTAFAAAAPEVRVEPRKYRGGYICPPGKLTAVTPVARNPVAAKEMWELTERFLSDIGV
ncbi:NAD(P)-binding protein [Wolfiporia cocos MD-104 SS10]|uniref:NAD(P)-binding protein n=1 Tax=Wolfiporia cocos (strain MD-104) TaxID=742152 RepID=A0A2H3JHR8_WOLCO|nr:NAD(P)-binding protein [Wolfiporia cocos MD-104 SS10]